MKFCRQNIHWKRQLGTWKILLLRQQCGFQTYLKAFLTCSLFTNVNKIHQLLENLLQITIVITDEI